MAARRLNKKEILEMEYKISELDSKGWKQHQIAKELGLNQQMVTYYLKKINQQLMNGIQHNLELKRQLQEEKLLLVQRELWDVLEELPDPKTKLKAFQVLTKVVDTENKLNHLYNIPPPQKHEDDLMSQSDADISRQIVEIIHSASQSDEGCEISAVNSTSDKNEDQEIDLPLFDLPPCAIASAAFQEPSQCNEVGKKVEKAARDTPSKTIGNKCKSKTKVKPLKPKLSTESKAK